MVKSFIISLVIVILCFGCKEVPEQKTILAQKGILDLTNVSFQETEIVNLDGDWDFYWKKFLSYEEILENKKTMRLYIGKDVDYPPHPLNPQLLYKKVDFRIIDFNPK